MLFIFCYYALQSAVDTALADSECYAFTNSDDRMSCFFDKVLLVIWNITDMF